MVPSIDIKAHAVVAPLVIGSKIRALRQRLKRTLDETATAAGISKPFLSQLERGHATPSITSLVGIARALGVAVQYFFDTPTEARSVCRGEELKFFSFGDSANLFGKTDESFGGKKAGSDSGQDATWAKALGSNNACR
jgi:transcriptional regulator with XRE-family HTH domain